MDSLMISNSYGEAKCEFGELAYRGIISLESGLSMDLKSRKDMVRKVLDSMALEYWEVECEYVIAAQITEDSQDPELIIFFDDDSISFYSYVGGLEDQKDNLEMYKLINLINGQSGGGVVALSEDRRDVFFRNTIELLDVSILTEDLIKKNLARAILERIRYGEGILAVASGFADADSAMEGLTSDVAN